MRVWIDLKYVTRKASGLYYYRRRVPDDLRSHYNNKVFYVQSLKTKELAAAEVRSLEKTKHLDVLWTYFRNPDDYSIPKTVRDRATALLAEYGFKPGDGGKALSKIDERQFFTAFDFMDEILGDRLDGVRYEGEAETEETAVITEAFKQLASGKVWYWNESNLSLDNNVNI